MAALSMDDRARMRLADALAGARGDVPQTCIALHALRTGRCRAWGDATALLVDPDLTRGELLGFGDDAAAIDRLLRGVAGWKCIEVAPSIADELAETLQRRLDCEIIRVPDLYFTLAGEMRVTLDPRARQLGFDDAERFARSGASYCELAEDAKRNVQEGPVVAAVIDARMVAAAEANVRTARYANFTVRTLPEFRGQGLATAAAALAAKIVRDMGLMPLWSCAETNLVSRRVAEKLGFTPAGSCTYLIPGR